MKVGDLVRYTKEHSSRPGYDYCATWTGIIFQDPNDPPTAYRIFWTTQHGSHAGAYSGLDDLRGMEVISESR